MAPLSTDGRPSGSRYVGTLQVIATEFAVWQDRVASQKRHEKLALYHDVLRSKKLLKKQKEQERKREEIKDEDSVMDLLRW